MKTLAETRQDTISAMERDYIASALRAAHGSIKEAARLAGVGRVQIHRYIAKYNLHDIVAQARTARLKEILCTSQQSTEPENTKSP